MADRKDEARMAAYEWTKALALLHEQDPAAAKAEMQQLLIDAMDAVQQSALMDDIVRAAEAFEGQPTGPQDDFKGAVHKDRDQLHEAVDVFLRQPMRPGEGSRVFPSSAVSQLEAALTASRKLVG
jgi:hypothetical protein